MASILRPFALLSLALGALSSPVTNEHLADTPAHPHNLVARAACNSDNLGRCFKPTGTKATDIASRSSATAFCSSYLQIPVVTSVVSTSTPITSITVTSTVTASTAVEISVSTENDQATEISQATITTTVAFPALKRAVSTVPAPKCASAAAPVQLSSACSCLSVTPSTTYVTATAPLATNTAVQLSSVTITSTTLTTLTAITGTTTVTSTAIATQTKAAVCSQLPNPYNDNGKIYSLTCDAYTPAGAQVPGGNNGDGGFRNGYTSLTSCIDFCNATPTCVYGFWISPDSTVYGDGWGNDCYLYSSIDSSTTYPVNGVMGLLLNA